MKTDAEHEYGEYRYSSDLCYGATDVGVRDTGCKEPDPAQAVSREGADRRVFGTCI